MNSSVAIRSLPEELKQVLSSSNGRGRLALRIGPLEFVVVGRGDPRLTFSHQTDLVVRKSDFVSDRTLMIHADKSSADIPRAMVRLLQDATNRVTVEISASGAEALGDQPRPAI